MAFSWLARVRMVLEVQPKINPHRKRQMRQFHGASAIVEQLEQRRVLSPVISGVESAAGAFAAGAAAMPVTNSTTLTDSDSSNLTGVTVSLGPTYRAGEDVLAFTNTANITGNFDASTGTLLLTGTDSVANYQTALRSITYQNTSTNPTPNIRRFTINATDGTSTSSDAYRYINMTSNLSNVETTTANFAAGSAATAVSNNVTLGNTASGNLSGATVQINANYVNGQDILAFTNTPNITGNFDASTGTLSLTGTDTVANYQAALRSITYQDTSNNPNPGIRRFAITAGGATNPNFVANRYFNITNGSVAGRPTISNLETSPGSFAAGGTAVPLSSSLTLSDASSNTLTGARVSLGPTYRLGEDVLAFTNTANITGDFDAASGELTLTGTDTVANYQAALRSLTYHNISDNPTPNIRRLTIIANNGTMNSLDAYRYINMTRLISNVETSTANFTQGSAPTAVTNTLNVGNTPNGTLSGASIRIDANYVNGEDLLAFNDTPTITGNFDASTGTLSLTGIDTVANYQAALRSITYANASANATMGIRRFAITSGGATNPSFVTNRYFNIA